MQIRHGAGTLDVFTISPRTLDADRYWTHIEQTIDWSDAYGATGILLFEGNDTFVAPWVAAHAALARTKSLSPLVAVNPIYMHPFSVAKMVSTFAYLYGRKTYLNMITGTALSYLEQMDDRIEHDRRYDRLREYSEVVAALVASGGEPVTYEGEFYTVRRLRLNPPVPPELQPVFFVAGQSEAALGVVKEIGAVHVPMLPSELADGLPPGATGVHFGLVTRPTVDEAWKAATETFPADRRGQQIQTYSMKNTDSVWKQRMMAAARMEGGGGKPGFWLEPFRNFQADCPYFVGSEEQVAELVASLARKGVRNIILDIPAAEREFAEIRGAFQLAEQLLSAAGAR